MSEDNSFEILTKKGFDMERNNNESSKNVSLTNSVPPPAALPIFVTSTAHETLPQNIFHSAPFWFVCSRSPKLDNNESDSTTENDSGADMETFAAVGSSLFDWVKGAVGTRGSSLLNKVAEKAKSSIDTVITIFDPQMGNIIEDGNNMGLIVASEKEVEVSAVREAFQNVFDQISVRGYETEDLHIPKQVVGFEAATTVALMKIQAIQKRQPLKYPIVIVQSFITNISDDKWYDLDLIILYGTEKSLRLETYSQMIPVPETVVDIMKQDTPKDFEFLSLGYNVTVAKVMGTNLQVHHSEWQETLTGVTRRQRILSAATIIANLYKNILLQL